MQEGGTVSAVEHVSASPNAQPEEVSALLETARSAVAQEFQVAERLDAKSRNQVAVGGAWYAVVQATAAIAIKQYVDNGGSSWLFAAIVALASVSGVMLAVAILYSYSVWKLRDEQEITHESLQEMSTAARDPSVDLLSQLVDHYGFILWTRRKNNKDRVASFRKSTPWWIGSILFGIVELIVALALVAGA